MLEKLAGFFLGIFTLLVLGVVGVIFFIPDLGQCLADQEHVASRPDRESVKRT